MRFIFGLRAKLLPLCGVLLLCGSARAATYTGNSATGYDDQGNCVQIAGNNSFDDARNWGGACTPGTVPGPGDTADLAGFGVAGTNVNVGTLIVNGNLTADSITTDNLTMSGGDYTGGVYNGGGIFSKSASSTLRVNNSFIWLGGSLSSGLTVTLPPACITTISGDRIGDAVGTGGKNIGGVVNNQGTINWSGASIVGGGTLDNSSTFNVLGDGLIGGGSAGSGFVFINSGTFNKVGGNGSTGIGAGNFINNGGTLAAQSGILNLTPSYGATKFTGGTVAAGQGAVEIDNSVLTGTITVNGTILLGTGGVDGGDVTFAGPGNIDWRAGGFGGYYYDGANQQTSKIVFAPDIRTAMTGTDTKSVDALTNKGVMTWNAAGNLSGAMKNEGTFNFLTDGALGGYYNGFSVVNTGTLAKTGGSGVLSIGQSVLDNSGTLDIQSGTLELSITPNGSPHHIRDGSVIKGSGRLLAFEPVLSDGTITVDATYQWGDESTPVYAVVGGTYKGSGHIEWLGGTVSGVTFSPGFTVNVSGSLAKGFSRSTSYGSSDSDCFNQGTFNWKGGAAVRFDGSPGAFVNSGVVNVGATGYFGGGIFVNSGMLNTFPGGITQINGTLRNTGTINLGDANTPGNLSFYGNDPYNGFVQTGIINTKIAGNGDGQFSQIVALSDANAATVIALGGTLNVSLAPGYSPASSDAFPLVKILPDRASYNGTFQTVNGLSFSGGKFKIAYNPADVTLSVAQPPILSVDSPSKMEGNSGTSNLPFTFTLSAAATAPVSFKYATADASAKTGIDYTGKSGTVTFAPGETSRVVNISILGDTIDENDETFSLNLSEAAGLTLARTQTTGTITDDDGQPSMTIGDVKVTEGDKVNVSATFTIRLSNPSSQTVTVKYATSDITAKAGLDYYAGSGTISIPPGQISKTLVVAVKGDTIDEPTETYQVKLTDPVHASLSDGIAIGTIFDNDPVPSISVKAPSVTEGNSGTTNLNFELKLSNTSDRIVTVQVHSVAAKTLPATAGVDYESLPSTTVTFAPGESRKIVSIAVKGDLLDEENERVGLELRSTVSATITGSTNGILDVEGTIIDDDASPGISINDILFQEGNSGTSMARFTVTLSAPAGREVKVGYSTLAGTAAAGSDFIAQSGQLTFAPGQTSQVVSIAIVGDTVVEANENFKVVLSAAINALISRPNGLGTILNDDHSAAGFLSAGSS